MTIYDRDIAINRFSPEPRITVRTEHPPGEGWSTAIYSGIFQDAQWSPDSRKIILSFKDGKTSRLVLHNQDTHSASNLNIYLSMGIEQSELQKYDVQDSNEFFPKIEYQFLQWSLDSRSMLIYYSFTDSVQESHAGYFWYNHEIGKISATPEL